MATRNRMKAVAAVAAAAIAVILAAGADPITVPNAGFELRETFDPLADGVNKYNQWAREYWRHWQRDLNGGPLRIWNPGAPGVSVEGFGGNAPEGTYVVSVSSRYSDGLNTDGVNTFEAAVQLLDATFNPTKKYALTVKVGNRPGVSWNGYAVQLAVGGVNVDGATYEGRVDGGTVIAQDANTLNVPVDAFVTSTVTYLPRPADADLAGQPLQIRLCALEDPANLALTGYAVFDDVTLDEGMPPPPSGAILMVR